MKNEIVLPDNYYSVEKECDYKGEQYLVRDNGAVLRKRKGNRKSVLDEIWTFGTKNPRNGYMYISSHRVHIIVATAFFGAEDSKKMVVDHIDTNRCNNRPENLRWLTRLENALLNPDTLNKITYLCGGDITIFLKDPSCLRKLTNDPKISWMRTVTPEEAKATYERIMHLNSTKNRHVINNELKEKELAESKEWNGDLLRKSTPPREIIQEPEPVFTRAKYPTTALQKDWKTPTEFPCCPEIVSMNPLLDYKNNLSVGKIFSNNVHGIYYVVDSQIIENGQVLLVASGDLVDSGMEIPMSYGLTKIYCSREQFIHEGLGTFWTKNGVMKQFTLLQGKEWYGPDSIDDYM